MRNWRSFLGVLAGGGLLGWCCLCAAPAPAEVKLPTLRTKQGAFTNVVVTGRSETEIFIRHERGFGNVKLEEIEDDDALVALGLKAPPVTVAVITNTVDGRDTVSTNETPTKESATARIEALVREQWAQLRQYRPNLGLMPVFLVLGTGLLIFLFFSYCLKLVCVKAGYQPGLAVWLPVLQAIPALRAAGMSALWLLAWIVPVLAVASLPLLLVYGDPALAAIGFKVAGGLTSVGSVVGLVAQILWCFKITSARGKSILVAILLLLPGLNLFAFLYLAFSSSGED